MLSKEQTERLTRVGPGTPMGDLLRRYWYPICFTRELDEFPAIEALLAQRCAIAALRSRDAGSASSDSKRTS